MINYYGLSQLSTFTHRCKREREGGRKEKRKRGRKGGRWASRTCSRWLLSMYNTWGPVVITENKETRPSLNFYVFLIPLGGYSLQLMAGVHPGREQVLIYTD